VTTTLWQPDQSSQYSPGAEVRSRGTILARRALLWIVIAAIGYLALICGLSARRWVWDNTDPIRFFHDAERQCYWALETTGPEGFLNQYEKMAVQDRRWEIFLDYVPLRLLVMDRWGVYLRKHFPEVNDEAPEDAWRRSYAFTAPLLDFNAFMDGVAAISAFLLTRLWVRRARPTPEHFTGVWQGSVAGLLIWFNPAILFSAYAWPTWDNWIIPMFLLAALLASLDWWFCSGVALVIGAMLKGQQLAVAPIFVLWPLLQGRATAAARWCIGLLLGMAVIASPWLLSHIPRDTLASLRTFQSNHWPDDYPLDLFAVSRTIEIAAIFWIAGIIAITIGARWLKKWGWAVAAAAVVLVVWPCVLRGNHSCFPAAILGGGILALSLLRLPTKAQPYVLAAAVGAALLSCIVLFNGSHAWWDCGFDFGASRWHWTASSLTDNLPGMLFERFGWSKDPDDVVWTIAAIPRHWPAFLARWQWWPAVDLNLTAKTLFNPIYTIFLLTSGVAISLQARRKSVRMLVALTLPWLVFFVFPVEIHGRYMLFPAGVSAICIGDSIGMGLLSVVMTIIATVQVLDDMLQSGDREALGNLLSQSYPKIFGPDFASTLYQYLQGTHPDLAWAVFLITGIFLYLAFTRAGRSAS